MKCDNCVINREVDVSSEYAVCAWYMVNVVLGNKTTDDCPHYKEVQDERKIRCDNCIHFEVCCYVSPQLPTCDSYKEKERHGEWIERLNCRDDYDDAQLHHMCSECKADAIFHDIVEDEYEYDEDIDGEWHYIGKHTVGIEEYLTDFCPNCGAKMDI